MGVKSLWKLLTPVGRPVLLETLEGKVLAIDSSIWIYQFQATMRDNDGKLFVNAHVLGFLRRICKLLFYGIKPVFVFDGGAPVLKRSTINERKRKKSGAATTHVKVAERLLAAQMRREAVEQVQGRPNSTKGKGKAPQGPVTIDDDAVYLEDLDDSMPKSPAKSSKPNEPGSSSKKKPRFHDHDPYHLPEFDFEAAIAQAGRSTVPDPRIATEEEMREFIEDMRPEDFDVNDPEFRELSTELQYEIIGDLRLKSRQTSYKRLQNMLKNAPTPLDFSKEQIKNLQQRNKLTQQLLVTTDSMGKANIAIPIRIASERNREYVLMKNEGEAGGWILGLRDEGTQAKPIVLDNAHVKVNPTENAESDDDMEEVPIPVHVPMDPHLREYQREMALSALAGRVKRPSKPIPKTTQTSRPLFDLDEEDELRRQENIEDDNEDEISIAIQASLEHQASHELQQVIDASRAQVSTITPARRVSGPTVIVGDDDDDDVYASPHRLATALSIGFAGPSVPRKILSSRGPTTFDKPTLLLPKPPTPGSPQTAPPSDDDMGSTASNAEPHLSRSPQTVPTSDDDMEEVDIVPSVQQPETQLPSNLSTTPQLPSHSRSASLEYVETDIVAPVPPAASPFRLNSNLLFSRVEPTESDVDMEEVSIAPITSAAQSLIEPALSLTKDLHFLTSPTIIAPLLHRERSEQPDASPSTSRRVDIGFNDDNEEPLTDWSRSPSPRPVPTSTSTFNPPTQTEETWDAAQEMDPDAEQGEFARFVSQMKGRDLDSVQKEIEEEIKDLKQQKKVAMRDSDDITQQMISQIMVMLRLFGIPYITAPMEAEAQCAELVSLGLVDGIITDDSDVFLFGGHRVFKHMFNQSKTVECFLSSDLTRELGLDRDTLVRLAYLLGSDYVDGLPGIGPVVAMELLKEFPGNDGLHKFKDWWMKVQTGKDKPEDNKSKFRNRFKKKFKDLYLASEWPNPAVRDAYYHPTVDESEEPFKWGLPDLDGLRGLLREELSWSQQKSDDLLLPIVQRVGKRRQAAALNKQGNLDNFFDINFGANGGGSFAPRKRQAYASKRLQQVVTDYRNEQKKQTSGSSAENTGREGDSDDDEEEDGSTKKKRKTTTKGKATATKAKKSAVVGTKRGRGRSRTTTGKRKAKDTDDDESYSLNLGDVSAIEAADAAKTAAETRPRPKPRPIRKAAQRAMDRADLRGEVE